LIEAVTSNLAVAASVRPRPGAGKLRARVKTPGD
jgi:hypothetical protein